MAEPKVDVYASSVAKTVFVWISIVLMIVGLIWDTIIRKKLSSGFGQALDVTQDVAITAVGFVPGYGTAISMGATAMKWFKQNGGRLLVGINVFLLIIYEAFWTPWKHLKDATIDVPETKPKQK